MLGLATRAIFLIASEQSHLSVQKHLQSPSSTKVWWTASITEAQEIEAHSLVIIVIPHVPMWLLTSLDFSLAHEARCSINGSSTTWVFSILLAPYLVGAKQPKLQRPLYLMQNHPNKQLHWSFEIKNIKWHKTYRRPNPLVAKEHAWWSKESMPGCANGSQGSNPMELPFLKLSQQLMNGQPWRGSCTRTHPQFLKTSYKSILQFLFHSYGTPLHVAFWLSSRNPFAPSASKTPRCKVFSSAFCNGCVNLSCKDSRNVTSRFFCRKDENCNGRNKKCSPGAKSNWEFNT